MPSQVQDLIDKIKSEGIQEAEAQAKTIRAEADASAAKIIADAEEKAQRIVVQAKEEAKKIHESTQMALKQAARDSVLSLRKNIEALLKQIVDRDIKDTLTAENLAKIITEVVKNVRAEDNVDITLSEKDLEALKKGYTAKLQKEMKGTLTFKASDDISKGLTVSFDKGKSSFDFSDESLAGYFSTFLNSQISEIVQESVS